MSWDPRLVQADNAEPPRMPATRCMLALVCLRPWEHMTPSEIVDLLTRHIKILSSATGVPKDILFGRAPTGFDPHMFPWNLEPIDEAP